MESSSSSSTSAITTSKSTAAKHSQSFAASSSAYSATQSSSSASAAATVQVASTCTSKSLNSATTTAEANKWNQDTTLRHDSAAAAEFEAYFNSNGSGGGRESLDGINYEAAYEQLQGNEDNGGEEGEDAESYRKVPIKDLINSFENQSRPVMRYKLADEQILKKAYGRQAPTTGKSSATTTSPTVAEDDKAKFNKLRPVEETTDEEQDQPQEEEHQQERQEQRQSSVAPNYDSDACQGIR